MKKEVNALCLVLLLTSCTYSKAAQKQKLFEFKTDICTLFPNQSQAHPDQDWSHCCVAHDISYWSGGPEYKRKQADDKLKSCVEKTGASEASSLMRTGVSVGGAPYLQTPWSWGFGWRRKKPYSAFTPKQVDMIIKKLPSVLKVIQSFKGQWTTSQYGYVRKYLEFFKDDLKKRPLN